MAKLDAMGTPAAFARLLAHNILYSQASRMDSLPFMESQAQAAVKASGELVGDDRHQWVWQSVDAFANKADFEGRLGHADAAVTTLRQAATDLGPLRARVREDLLGRIYPYTLYGKPAVKLSSTYAYAPGQPAQPASTTTTNRPTAGKVALLLFVNKMCGEPCFPGYAVATRLIRQYETVGLELTLVTRTGGWDRDRLVKPQEESDSLRALFHDYLKVPATLVVWATEFGKNADGHLRIRTMPNDQAYFGPQVGAPPNAAALIDKAGVVRHVTFVTLGTEQRLRNMIAELLQ